MPEKNDIEAIRQKTVDMRRDVIEMGYAARERGAHFGPALSSIEIMAALFFKVMNQDPQNPSLPERDRFIQSKGHACLSYYAALIERGYISKALLPSFKKNGSFLSGHPSRNMDHGIEVSSGSLGNGFSIACGMAAAAKLQGKSHQVYCLVGDGECNEGILWEAAMNAHKNKLSNMVAIVDRNGVQLAGKTEDIMNIDLEALWKAVGWEVLTVERGNDLALVIKALEKARDTQGNKPRVVIAHTTKGKGVSFMEGSLVWHARPLKEEQYHQALSELKDA